MSWPLSISILLSTWIKGAYIFIIEDKADNPNDIKSSIFPIKAESVNWTTVIDAFIDLNILFKF